MRMVRMVLLCTLLAAAAAASDASAVQFDPPPAFEEVYARTNTILGVPVPAARNGSTAWGDLDADGDFDLVVTGNLGSFESPEPFLQVYFNDGDFATQDLDEAGNIRDAFVTVYREAESIEAALPVWLSAVAMADADNDGDVDILVTGVSEAGTAQLQVYKNEAGPGSPTFRSFYSAPGVRDATVVWADYDNDGDQDFLAAGTADDGSARSTLFENQGRGDFVPSTQLPGMHAPSADWGDYDKDGDHDLLMTGILEPQEFATRLYRNDGNGVFTVADAGFDNLLYAAATWGDYEGDGDLDVLLTGGRLHHFLVAGDYALYENLAGSFVPGAVEVEGHFDGQPAYGRYRGSVSWGDYDNDGFLDFFMAGAQGPGTGPQVQVYRSAGLRRFAANAGQRYIMPPFAGGFFSSTLWGDYDGDGDLDVFLLRQEGQDKALRLATMRNYLPSVRRNAAPEPPDSLAAEPAEAGLVTLRWTQGNDRRTPDAALTYNIRVGTAPGGLDVASPLASLHTGRRLIAARGNAGNNRTWSLSGLAPGTYYWSVQAIDSGYLGSVFSTEATFIIR